MDWRKSSYSGASGDSCVETASGQGVILVRDTTNRDGGTLAFGAAAWERFTKSVQSPARHSRKISQDEADRKVRA